MSKNPWLKENFDSVDKIDVQRLANHLRCIENALIDLSINLADWLDKPKKKTSRQLAYDMALDTQFIFRMMAGLESILLKPHKERIYE